MKGHADVLICGTGPAAAYAVMACKEAGVSCDVVSKQPPQAQQAGAFFLHWLPSWLRATPEQVEVWGEGSPEVYLAKQWQSGEAVRHLLPECSFPAESRVEQWYSSTWLDKVWAGVQVHSVRQVVDDRDLCIFAADYQWVFHSFTTWPAAENRHLVRFPTLTHAEAGKGINRIIYHGTPAQMEVRTTVAWGRLSVEFPDHCLLDALAPARFGFGKFLPSRVLLRDIGPYVQPVTPAEYLLPNVVPIGRFATWDRKALSHHTFERVLACIQKERV